MKRNELSVPLGKLETAKTLIALSDDIALHSYGRLNTSGDFVLTSKNVHEGVSSILESLRSSDLEGAKRKLDELSSEVKGEREKGRLMAASGIYTGMMKGKDGSIQSWGAERIRRAAKAVESGQMADDFDRGYAETLLAYADIMQKQA